MTDTNDKEKWEHLKDLASQCRILSLISLIYFAFCSIVLTAACITSLRSGGDDSEKYDLSQGSTGPNDDTRRHAILLIVATILSIIGAIASDLLLLATCSKSVPLTVPFWFLILALLMYYFYQLLHFGFCVGRCGYQETEPDTGNIHSVMSPFSSNILNGGVIYIFSSVTVIAFLTYAFLPTFGFFLECLAKRAEEQKEARLKNQARLYPQRLHSQSISHESPPPSEAV